MVCRFADPNGIWREQPRPHTTYASKCFQQVLHRGDIHSVFENVLIYSDHCPPTFLRTNVHLESHVDQHSNTVAVQGQ